MPSRRPSRSLSPEHRSSKHSRRRDRSRSHSRSRSRERSEKRSPPAGVEPISEDDYFLKSAEFSRWLRVEKKKYFDELRADKARHYFRKFVKAWNRGRLKDDLYKPLASTSIPSNQQTAYKWTFTSKQTGADEDELDRVRNAVGGDTYGASTSFSRRGQSDESSNKRIMKGPTLPSSSDLQLAREEAETREAASGFLKRKRDKLEARDRLEDVVGPKEVGREGMLEKKRAKRESNKAFREGREDGGLEVSEDVLMGGGSLQERIAQRDAARARFEAKRKGERDAREQERNERVEQIKERDRKTMEMFKQMAKEKFG